MLLSRLTTRLTNQPTTKFSVVLAGKRIVLGVTGGIAAYKAIEISRRLVDAGAHVIPVMTEAAQRFVGPTTLSALASEPVRTRLWDDPDTPIPHTKLGQSADLVVVAPATARVIAAYRMGLATDLLTNVLLATAAPVMICPAMHTEMWDNPAVVDNIAVLRQRGVHIVEPTIGRLAGGDQGAGRLADPAAIVAAIDGVFHDDDLDGVKIVISAGGTREPIDAVRVIANRSSGKQGYALAAAAAARGAEVTLVSTVDLPVPAGVEVIGVDTAAEMKAVIEPLAAQSQVVIMAAAVADFRPQAASAHKLKKRDGIPDIVLEPTPDIVSELAAHKPEGQIVVGFAAETDDLEANARHKLVTKGLDMIVANDVNAPLTGFGFDTNAVTIYSVDDAPVHIALTSKRDVAEAVLDRVADRLGR
ncbi:MAG: bifunctional phosphopantothenoylcysteine decarboxylase/phosphopantothenate--cysteine ligase CoaBC [Ilumatobacter coccineus]|uniref:Coenzyme A biosynthesis bifunctional protein CoaBC n=1 Tax=Ilumatobacter coccineus TaxID=467094 RepID=A0A2G6KEZ3_9ACTN|nr:MAG: bifunctional phosphopantothenoylcysteine decarboxylase/phosphopantothenate--cysteine ligase CoaBC [Ilumatobacter coccineus]